MTTYLLPLLLLAFGAAASVATQLTLDLPQEREAAGAPAPTPRVLCSGVSFEKANLTSWECRNWAGTVSWAPSQVFSPASEGELSAWLASTFAQPEPPTMKVVGYAHSWAGLYTPAPARDGRPGVTVALHKLSGVTRLSPTHVEVLAGTSFAQLFSELERRGLALAWPPGGIQGLTVGGAVSVGFHGSQISVGGVSSVVSALRLVDTAGKFHDLDDESQPQAMRAARMGLGQCGIMTRVTLPVVPQFHLRRRRWRVDDVDAFLDRQLAPLKAAYDRFHWYSHPASGSAWPMFWEPATAAESAAEARPCRTASEQSEDAKETWAGKDGLPLIMRWDNCSDVSYRALTHAVDMEEQPLWNGEYYLATDDAGEAAAARAILARFAALSGGKPNPDIWMHIRYVAGDTNSLLNPCYGHTACAAFELALVAPAMDAPLPPWREWDAYFRAMEDVLVPLGGRPHHAKYRSERPNVAPGRPSFGLPVRQFRAQCAAFDPHRQLRSEAFDRTFGAPGLPVTTSR